MPALLLFFLFVCLQHARRTRWDESGALRARWSVHCLLEKSRTVIAVRHSIVHLNEKLVKQVSFVCCGSVSVECVICVYSNESVSPSQTHRSTEYIINFGIAQQSRKLFSNSVVRWLRALLHWIISRGREIASEIDPIVEINSFIVLCDLLSSVGSAFYDRWIRCCAIKLIFKVIFMFRNWSKWLKYPAFPEQLI